MFTPGLRRFGEFELDPANHLLTRNGEVIKLAPQPFRMFVNSGFTPAEALQTATSNVAQCAGRLQEFGTVEAGKRADIVLLDANPLEDIRNTRKIHAVIVGGRFFSRSELVDMVDRAVRGR